MNYLYALPHAYYEKYRVRKYGFHGTSHHYVARKGAELAGLDYEKSKIVTCHIGNGASVTAVLDGKSYDTSMGFSPLDGLVMGTRCGAIDASAITFIGAKEGMSYAELDEMMNKRSGVQGMTDLSSDMRDIDKAYDEGNPRAIVARDMYYNRVKKFVGAYAAEMGGVDLIVFTGGVGENSRELRRSVCAGLEFMGVEFDPAANEVRGEDKILSTPASRVKVAVIATDEELMIATDTTIWSNDPDDPGIGENFDSTDNGGSHSRPTGRAFLAAIWTSEGKQRPKRLIRTFAQHRAQNFATSRYQKKTRANGCRLLRPDSHARRSRRIARLRTDLYGDKQVIEEVCGVEGTTVRSFKIG